MRTEKRFWARTEPRNIARTGTAWLPEAARAQPSCAVRREVSKAIVTPHAERPCRRSRTQRRKRTRPTQLTQANTSKDPSGEGTFQSIEPARKLSEHKTVPERYQPDRVRKDSIRSNSGYFESWMQRPQPNRLRSTQPGSEPIRPRLNSSQSISTRTNPKKTYVRQTTKPPTEHDKHCSWLRGLRNAEQTGVYLRILWSVLPVLRFSFCSLALLLFLSFDSLIFFTSRCGFS